MNLTRTPPTFTTGRQKIFCYEEEITKENVVRVVEAALLVHEQNVKEIEWLFQLYKGKDIEIESRVREGANEDINYKAFVSYYSLIADYHANLFMQNPLVYTNVDGDERTSELIVEYNKLQRQANKHARDKTAALHAAICGVGFQFTEQSKKTVFKHSVLSPLNTFSMYGDDTEDESMAKVYLTQVYDKDSVLVENITKEAPITYNNLNTKRKITVYTNDFIYSWIDDDKKEVDVKPAMSWGCPIVEYKFNPFYIGAFERVTSLIHLLSVLRSDGVNGVVQSIAGLILGKNIGIPMDSENDTEEERTAKEAIREQFRKDLKAWRQIWVNEQSKDLPVSIEYVATELFNADIEILYQGILNDIITLTITPNSVVNLGGSGNTGAARTASGENRALENAKNFEPYWFESAREQTRIDLAICHYSGVLVDLDDGKLDFAMQRSAAVEPISAAQAYQVMIQSGVKPADAASFADITADPESWEKRVIEWREKQQKQQKNNEEKFGGD